jgi:hypothetical protein
VAVHDALYAGQANTRSLKFTSVVQALGYANSLQAYFPLKPTLLFLTR